MCSEQLGKCSWAKVVWYSLLLEVRCFEEWPVLTWLWLLPLQLLNRVFNIMREKNPDMVAGEKRKFVMKPPQVVRVGTKKTSFVNFTDICKLWVSPLDFPGRADGCTALCSCRVFWQVTVANQEWKLFQSGSSLHFSVRRYFWTRFIEIISNFILTLQKWCMGWNLVSSLGSSKLGRQWHLCASLEEKGEKSSF